MSTTPVTTNLGMVAASPAIGGARGSDKSDGNWYEALSQAWGKTLDNEASRISTMSDALGAGNENPSDITKLTAETMRMSFLSQSSSSSIDSVGKSLETMARKG